MITNIEFNGYGGKYPTSSGDLLRLGPGQIYGKLRLYFDHKEKELDSGSMDVIAAEFLVPDSKGRVWKMTNRFTATLFLRYPVDLTVWDSGMSFLEDCNPEIKQALEDNLLLRNVICYDDIKRSYLVCISNRIVNLNFKFSACTFDIAAYTSKLVIVKINERSILSDNDYIGNIVYLMPIDVFLKNNTAVYHKPISLLYTQGIDEYWFDSEIPFPVYFESTAEFDDSQFTVQLDEVDQPIAP